MSSWSEALARSRVVRAGDVAAHAWTDVADPDWRIAGVAPSVLHEATQDGFRRGYEDGYAAGLATAAAEADAAQAARDADLHTALGALCRASDLVACQQVVALQNVEEAVVTAALELAASVLERDVAASADPGSEALARALRLADPADALTVRLHPDDLALMPDPVDGDHLRVVVDPSVGRGGCVVEAPAYEIDARLATAVERLRRELFE